MVAVLDRSYSFMLGVLAGIGLAAALGWFRFLGYIAAGLVSGLIARGLWLGALAGFFSGVIGEEVAFALYGSGAVDEKTMFGPWLCHAGSVGIIVEMMLVFATFGCLTLTKDSADERIPQAILAGLLLGALIFLARAPGMLSFLLPFWLVVALAPGFVGLVGGATGGLINR